MKKRIQNIDTAKTPKDILALIFSKLDLNDIISCSMVSKKWYHAANKNLVWESLLKRKPNLIGKEDRIAPHSNPIYIKKSIVAFNLEWKIKLLETAIKKIAREIEEIDRQTSREVNTKNIHPLLALSQSLCFLDNLTNILYLYNQRRKIGRLHENKRTSQLKLHKMKEKLTATRDEVLQHTLSL